MSACTSSVAPTFPRPFPGEILLDPCPETGGHLREHRALMGYPDGRAEPQWSPPLIGGSTSQNHAAASCGCTAAMEPAVDRSEHLTEPCGGIVWLHSRNGARR